MGMQLNLSEKLRGVATVTSVASAVGTLNFELSPPFLPLLSQSESQSLSPDYCGFPMDASNHGPENYPKMNGGGCGVASLPSWPQRLVAFIVPHSPRQSYGYKST
jgi:hypothetical protein